MTEASGAGADRAEAGLSRPLTLAQVIADHAALVPAKRIGAMRNTALRTKSLGAREILAHLATHGALDAAALISLGDAATTDLEAAAGQVPLDPISEDDAPAWTAWAAFAYVVALQIPHPAEQRAARGLYDLSAHVHGDAHLTTADITVWAQLLATQSVEDPSLVERVRAVLRHPKARREVVALTEADLAHPRLHPPARGSAQAAAPEVAHAAGQATRQSAAQTAEQDWITDLSAALVGPSRVGLRVHPGDAPALDRLHGASGPTIETGPLITVIMSAYNPGADALVAARSIVDQTWQNWELLVVDDRSPDPAPGIWRDLAALDPRIRVIHKHTNGGTYSCRNVALTQARGEYVTCLDSDDWAHPQRLELGVRPMLDDPRILATRSAGVRATSDLVITRVGYPGRFDAASSLMFRLDPVFNRVGFFDPVRKAADTEYARRIEVTFGTTVHDIGEDVMTILRSSPESLSADDFSRGWRHESRAAYKQAYGAWHEAIAAGADPYLDPSQPRPFPAPRRWSAVRDARTPHVDLVLGGDWRRFGGPQVSMLEEIAAAREAGLSVGIMHLEAMRFYTANDDPLCAPVRELIDAGDVERVYPDDDLDIDVLLVRYP
ncbi:glycosyltransferase family A protein, partial [Kribbia dieselivorans]|uniref:glycosyltransferase family A protein n=1 Tax=Kribbia dieselivorans TaxID=331526 RepID=UPI0012EE031C